MAEKQINELPAAQQLTDDALILVYVPGTSTPAQVLTGTQFKAYAIAAAQSVSKGADGITPHIGDNGNWYLGDVDTEVAAAGQDGQDGNTPYIGANGHWWIGNTDTGVSAQGPAGDGTGDMLSEVYDPQGKEQDIFAYVDDQIGDISTILDSINGEVV